MSQVLTLTDDEFDIINAAVANELYRATMKAQKTEELLRSSNALGYADMSRAYAHLLARARKEVEVLQNVQEMLDSTQFNTVIFKSEDVPF